MTLRLPLSFFHVYRKTQYKVLTLEVFGSFTKAQGFSSPGDWLQAIIVVVSFAGERYLVLISEPPLLLNSFSRILSMEKVWEEPWLLWDHGHRHQTQSGTALILAEMTEDFFWQLITS